MDKYNERLIEAKATPFSILGLIGSVVVAILGGIVFILSPAIGVILLAAGILLITLCKDSLNIEYEFILTNGDIEIAKVIAKKRRKTIGTIELDKIARMDRADDDRVKNDISLGKVKVKRFIGKEPGDNLVAIYCGEDDNKTLTILDFDEKCIEHMNSVLKMKSSVKI